MTHPTAPNDIAAGLPDRLRDVDGRMQGDWYDDDSCYRVTVREAADALELLSVAALAAARCVFSDCDECGAPAAEFWLWKPSRHGEEDDLTHLCAACVGDRKDECSPAEPEDEIAIVAKVRHLLPWKLLETKAT